MHIKLYEIESFKLPIEKLTDSRIEDLEKLYEEYLVDIEANAQVRQTKQYANIDSFREYKIGKSKKLIDKIDKFIGPLYGLTDEEIQFIINYDLEFRTDEEN